MSSSPKLIIAVTGGCGDIGLGIVKRALEDGHTVVAIDHINPDLAHGKLPLHERITYQQAELANYDAFLEAVRGCDALVHLAAVYSLQDPKNPDGPLLRDIPEHVRGNIWSSIASRSLTHHQVVHNTNTALSWNALNVAAQLGIKRVALASSVNAVGLSACQPRGRGEHRFRGM